MPNQKQNTPVFEVGKGETRKDTNRALPFHTTYDALGRRIKRTQGASVTKFVYDGMDVIRDDANGVITRYQNGLGIDNKLKGIVNSGRRIIFCNIA